MSINDSQKKVLRKMRDGKILFSPMEGHPYFMDGTFCEITNDELFQMKQQELVQYRTSDNVYLTESGRTTAI